jgi:metal-dependent amidase/aminoacylase/carboxypeptidase family protein
LIATASSPADNEPSNPAAPVAAAQEERARLNLGAHQPIHTMRAVLEEAGLHVFLEVMDPKLAGLYDFVGDFGYCVLVNSVQETNFARQVGLELVGSEKVIANGPPLTGSEDFAFMLEKIPGSYLLIGNGDGDSAGACMVHNPGYDFNDDILATGSAYWVALVERFFAD